MTFCLKTLSITTFSITTLIITTFSITVISIITPSIVTFNIKSMIKMSNIKTYFTVITSSVTLRIIMLNYFGRKKNNFSK